MNELEKFFNQETSKEYDEVWNSKEIDFSNLEEKEEEPKREEQKKIVIDGKEYSEEELKELLNKKQEEKKEDINEKIKKIFESLDETYKNEILISKDTNEQFINSVKDGSFEKLYPKIVEIKKNNPFSTWYNAFQLAYNNIKPDRAIKDKSDVDEIIDNKKEPKQEVGSKKDDYDEIWSKDLSFNELEQMLIEGV